MISAIRTATLTLALMIPTVVLAAPGQKDTPKAGSIEDMIAWFAAHPGVAVALVVGLTALVTGFVLNRESKTQST